MRPVRGDIFAIARAPERLQNAALRRDARERNGDLHVGAVGRDGSHGHVGRLRNDAAQQRHIAGVDNLRPRRGTGLEVVPNRIARRVVAEALRGALRDARAAAAVAEAEEDGHPARGYRRVGAGAERVICVVVNQDVAVDHDISPVVHGLAERVGRAARHVHFAEVAEVALVGPAPRLTGPVCRVFGRVGHDRAGRDGEGGGGGDIARAGFLAGAELRLVESGGVDLRLEKRRVGRGHGVFKRNIDDLTFAVLDPQPQVVGRGVGKPVERQRHRRVKRGLGAGGRGGDVGEGRRERRLKANRRARGTGAELGHGGRAGDGLAGGGRYRECGKRAAGQKLVEPADGIIRVEHADLVVRVGCLLRREGNHVRRAGGNRHRRRRGRPRSGVVVIRRRGAVERD